jgi:hypothetical protein
LEDISKFSKLETISLLIQDGTITETDKSFKKNFGLKNLRKLFGSNHGFNFNTLTNEFSREEQVQILGESMVERMETLKEQAINTYVNDSHYIEREPDASKRKALVEKEFKWDVAEISKLIFENNPKDMTADFINSPEFKQLAKKLLVVMFNDFKVEKNYDVMIKRLGNILLTNGNSDVPGKVNREQNISIDQLENSSYFNITNGLKPSAVESGQAKKDILPIEAKIDRNVGVASAGRRLVGIMGEGFTKPGELNIALAKALCYFKSFDEMKQFLGVNDEGIQDEKIIAQRAFDTYKDALDKFANGDLAENEFREIIGLIRVVSTILMLAKHEEGLVDMVNNQNYDAIQSKVNLMTVGLKNKIFVDVFKSQDITNDKVFGIDIAKLKTVLEKKDNKIGKRVLSNKLEDLMPLIKGKRIRVDALTNVRNSARAVAAAA